MGTAEPTINVLAMVKGKERFILLFDDANKGNAVRQVDIWAGDDEIDFTWYDAHKLTERILLIGKPYANRFTH